MTSYQLICMRRFFGTCTIFGFILLYIWFAAYALPGNLICDLSSRFFALNEHECSIMNYGGIILMKVLIIVFFFFPWLALRLFPRNHK